MSYDIYIGNRRWRDRRVERLELPEAPAFPGDPLSQHTNGRHPGYSGWYNFLQNVGLHELFMDRDKGLMRNHPGIVPLKREHLAEVEAALKRHRRQHGNDDACPPGWCSCATCDEISPPHLRTRHLPRFTQPESGDRARLLWLRFWMDYALTHCRLPALENF